MLISASIWLPLVACNGEQQAIEQVTALHSRLIVSGNRVITSNQVSNSLDIYKIAKLDISETTRYKDSELSRKMKDLDELLVIKSVGIDNCTIEWLNLRASLIDKYQSLEHIRLFVLDQSSLQLNYCFEHIELYLEQSSKQSNINAAIGWLRLLKFHIRQILPVNYEANMNLIGEIPLKSIAKATTLYLKANGIEIVQSPNVRFQNHLDFIDNKFDRLISKYCGIIVKNFAIYSAFLTRMLHEHRNILTANFSINDWMESNNVCSKLQQANGHQWYIESEMNLLGLISRLGTGFLRPSSPIETSELIEKILKTNEVKSKLVPNYSEHFIVPTLRRVHDLMRPSGNKCRSDTFIAYYQLISEFMFENNIVVVLKNSAVQQVLECLDILGFRVVDELNSLDWESASVVSMLRELVEKDEFGSEIFSGQTCFERLVERNISKENVSKLVVHLEGKRVMNLMNNLDISASKLVQRAQNESSYKLAEIGCRYILRNLAEQFDVLINMSKLTFTRDWLKMSRYRYLVRFMEEFNICRNFPFDSRPDVEQ